MEVKYNAEESRPLIKYIHVEFLMELLFIKMLFIILFHRCSHPHPNKATNILIHKVFHIDTIILEVL